MDRHFALPIAFAAAAHGALLFAFTKPTRTPPPPEEKRAYQEVVVAPPAEIEPPKEEETAGGGGSPKPELVAPIPRGAEPPPMIDPGPVFIIPLPPVGPVVRSDAKIVPVSFGRPGGGDGPGWGPGDVLTSAMLDNPPETRYQASPIYPFEGKTQGIRGDVLVEFLVDERGRVLDPRIVRSSHRMFEEPSLRAVAKWQFVPGRRDGRVVRFRMAVPMLFTLQE